MQTVHAIVDLQFGSTGKGLLAGYLAKRLPVTACVTAWGPNAGHTFIDTNGKKYVHTQLANGIVGSDVREIFIGPGSVIDTSALAAEIEAAGDVAIGKKLVIHGNAMVLRKDHSVAEASLLSIGSTQKGMAAANAERMLRNHGTVASQGVLIGTFASCVVSPREYSARLRRHQSILVEGHQGFSLSIYHGMYPYVTSRDTTIMAVLADCGMDRPRSLTVYGTLRTFPIRVSNRFDDSGKQIGFSGPCYDDQKEISWESLGISPELTTVTKRVRRVFSYSRQQVAEAAKVNGVDKLFVNFLNYLPPLSRLAFIEQLTKDTGVKLDRMLFGMGASENDIYTESEYADAD